MGDGAGVELGLRDGVRGSSSRLDVIECDRIRGGSTREAESAGGGRHHKLVHTCRFEEKVRRVELGSGSHVDRVKGRLRGCCFVI